MINGVLDPIIGDGVADDTEPLRQRLTWACWNGGGTVHISASQICRITGPLYAYPNVELRLDGRIVKDFDNDGTNAPFAVENLRMDYNVNNFKITGNGTIGSRSWDYGGGIVRTAGNNIQFRDFTVDTYAEGQAFLVSGDSMVADNVKVYNSAVTAGTGAFRYMGGTGLRVSNCHMESGDDVYQFVPGEKVGNIQHNLNTSDGEYRDCTGMSTAGRFMIAFQGDAANTCDITNVHWINCHGQASNRGVVIDNWGSGVLDGVQFTDCSVEIRPESTNQGEDIQIVNAHHITFTRFELTESANAWFRVYHDAANVTFQDCTFRHRTDRSQVGEYGAALAYPTDGSDTVLIDGCIFEGGGTEWGLVIDFGATNSTITDNDFIAIDSPIPLIDNGVGTVISGNLMPGDTPATRWADLVGPWSGLVGTWADL